MNSTEEPETTTTEMALPEDDGGTTTTVLMAVLIPLGAITMVLVAIYLCIRHKRSSIKLAKPISAFGTKSRRLSINTIPVYEFNAEYYQRLSSGQIEEEFSLIQEYSRELHETKSRGIGNLEVNKSRNRFVDIIPFDDTLVELKESTGTPPSTYINASYIQGLEDSVEFIATQGPKRNTCVDFWNMVIQENAKVVVCLTNLIEGGRLKCFQYWPDVGEMLNFDEMTLVTRDEISTTDDNCKVRTIEIIQEVEMDVKRHKVIQIHLTSWPDHGVLETTSPLLEVSKLLAYHQCPEIPTTNTTTSPSSKASSSPVVIHCSAGVGRTGTLIAVHLICQQISQYRLSEINIFSMVKRLRRQRPNMVQTLEQYVFIHDCIRDYINLTYREKRKTCIMGAEDLEKKSDDEEVTPKEEASLCYDNLAISKDEEEED